MLICRFAKLLCCWKIKNNKLRKAIYYNVVRQRNYMGLLSSDQL